jgi:transposase InsO family protein
MNREEAHLNLRRKFWIIDGRNAVKAAWHDCQVCRNNRAKPCPPLMGQLPTVRVTPCGRAFTHTGLDYFGPMTVKIGRRQEKRYGVLFTCLTIRAIHIDVVSDLTTTSALMALRRFIARRGCPKTIWSDNATTFRGADRELQKAVRAIDKDELVRYGSMRRIEWRFIPPASPHMGGCWERMVKAVKTALKATLKTRVPREDTLATVLIEAEAIVNGRPLTYVPLDHIDDLPLTPNDFLFPMTDRTDITTTSGTFADGDLLRRSWRESQRLADLLWKRWVKEYLPTLTRREKWYRTSAPLVDGDVVVIADSQSPRNLWLRGIVIKTYPGRDGQVRVADVRTEHGLYQRPVTKLCRLDVRLPTSTSQGGPGTA